MKNHELFFKIKSFLKAYFTKERHQGAFEDKEETLNRMMKEIGEMSDQEFNEGMEKLKSIFNKR